ncbi:wings apart-like protein regulation of heterochromatin-domain-containing protein [Limtongia smithiae]|uniref:wings apart-like protein regulation of heterochromatin-domain-containing protein n=1 Tax=Limtongia smithiae TaxID=1125753 RepID=UPI0034CFE5BF
MSTTTPSLFMRTPITATYGRRRKTPTTAPPPPLFNNSNRSFASPAKRKAEDPFAFDGNDESDDVEDEPSEKEEEEEELKKIKRKPLRKATVTPYSSKRKTTRATPASSTTKHAPRRIDSKPPAPANTVSTPLSPSFVIRPPLSPSSSPSKAQQHGHARTGLSERATRLSIFEPPSAATPTRTRKINEGKIFIVPTSDPAEEGLDDSTIVLESPRQRTMMSSDKVSPAPSQALRSAFRSQPPTTVTAPAPADTVVVAVPTTPRHGRRSLSPPPLEDLEFALPSAPQHTPSPSRISPDHRVDWLKRASPRMSARQSEIWKLVESTTASPSTSPRPTKRGALQQAARQHDGKLFKSLTARKEVKHEGTITLAKEATPKEDNLGVLEVADSQPEVAAESQVPVASLSSQLARSTRVTYGSQRSYLEERSSVLGDSSQTQARLDMLSDAELLSMTAMPGSANDDAVHDDSEASDEEASDRTGGTSGQVVKSIHELRASGLNAKFLDDMEYLLDGLRPNSRISATRLTCLELATKLTDRAFVTKFKAGGFHMRVFRSINDAATVEDAVASFALAATVCSLLSDEGVVLSLLMGGAYDVVGLLMSLVERDGDVSVITLATNKKVGVSKVTQSLLKDLCEKIAAGMSDSGVVVQAQDVTRRLVGLTGLVELVSKYGERYPQVREELLCRGVWSHMIACVARIYSRLRTSAMCVSYKELALGLLLLEEFAESAVANNGDAEDEKMMTETTYALVREQLTVPRDHAAESSSLAILKFAIIVTNNTHSPLCHVLGADEDVVGVLLRLIARVVDDDEEDAGKKEYTVAANIGIFCIGLLTNLSENADARAVLRRTKWMREILRLFTASIGKGSERVYMSDMRGYLALLVGLLLVSEGKDGTVADLAVVASVGKELETFRDAAVQLYDGDDHEGEEATRGAPTRGRGVVAQIGAVLRRLYAS